MTQLYNDYINKIEGHGVLHINFKNEEVMFEVSEGERLFEGLVLEKDPDQIPFIVSRICGVCPTVHYLTAIKALEKALRVEPSPETILLRKLMLAAQIIQSHNLHLFFLVLPDHLKLAEGENLAEKYPTEFHIALNLKRVADKILTVIGGRSIHPINPVIGGFSVPVTYDQLSDLRFDLEQTFDEAEYAIDLFSQIKYPEFKNPASPAGWPTVYLALKSANEYAIYDGIVNSDQQQTFPARDFQTKLTEKIMSDSTAKVAFLGKKNIMVGAMARTIINAENLNLRTQAKMKKSNLEIVKYNTYYNILAQAIEIMHFIEESIKLIDQLQKTKLNCQPEPHKVMTGQGVGACEAPRGTLYHYYEISDQGKIAKANIITPTGQSLSNLESDAQKILETSRGLNRQKLAEKIETLIRAYDPCLTCSVH